MDFIAESVSVCKYTVVFLKMFYVRRDFLPQRKCQGMLRPFCRTIRSIAVIFVEFCHNLELSLLFSGGCTEHTSVSKMAKFL